MIDTILDSFFDQQGTPYCARCFYKVDFVSEFELDDDGNLSCPNCGLVIEVEEVE